MKYSIFFTLSLVALANANPCSIQPWGSQRLVCENIQEFPVVGFHGLYDELIIDGSNSNFTKIPYLSFPGIASNSIRIVNSQTLEEIEYGFMDGFLVGRETQTKYMQLAGNRKLKTFPWTLTNFTWLETLEVIDCGFESIPANIEWPETIETIILNSLYDLKTIESNAFSSAINLKSVSIQNTVNEVVVQTNGFHTTSKHPKSLSQYSYTSKAKLQADAFGMESGGELWDTIAVPTEDFSEYVFRNMLSKAAEAGYTTMLTNAVGTTVLQSCQTCDIAWLYRDAKKYGVGLYESLLGQGNVICEDYNSPFVTITDPDFIDFMESCYEPCTKNGNSLLCNGIEELPVEGYEGEYVSIDISFNIRLKSLKRNSFPGISAEYISIRQNPELVEIEDGFFDGSESKVNQFYMQACPKFTSEGFPWNYTEKFSNLGQFHLQFMDILSVPGNIQWSKSVNTIRLQHCDHLNLIEPYAFSTATNLTFLELYTTGDGLVVQPNGFHTQSKQPKTLLHLQSYGGDPTVLEGNAFGFDSGSELWDLIAIPVKEFPENVFRSMMKGAFEQNKESLLGSNVGSMNVKSCSTCDAAWLWQDAHTYGVEAYEKLTGGGVYCQNPSIGPVITNKNPDFIALMDKCINGGNPCENTNDADVPDPNDCQCFYQCDFGDILGHICCPDGLVFNPNSLVCDYPSSYPECEINKAK